MLIAGFTAMVCVAVFGAGSALASSTTVGGLNPTANAFTCLSGTVTVDTTYVVPSTGQITSFSFAGAPAAADDQLDFLVLRPAGGNNYTVVGHTGLVTLAASGNNTTPASIRVQGGEVLGLWAKTSVINCFHPQAAGNTSQASGVSTDPAVGSTVAAPPAFAGYDLNESAVLRTTQIVTSASTGTALGPISDLAALTNEAGNGTLNFKVYSDAACTTLAGQSNVAVSGDGIYSSGNITAGGAGAYFWVVTYTVTNPSDTLTSPCGARGETSLVGKATPTLIGKVPARAGARRKVTATATLSGGASPTGMLTFQAFKSRTCKGAAAFSYQQSVAGNQSYRSVAARLQAGTYYWQITYAGDANNAAAASQCGASGERLKVTALPKRHHKRKQR